MILLMSTVLSDKFRDRSQGPRSLGDRGVASILFGDVGLAGMTIASSIDWKPRPVPHVPTGRSGTPALAGKKVGRGKQGMVCFGLLRGGMGPTQRRKGDGGGRRGTCLRGILIEDERVPLRMCVWTHILSYWVLEEEKCTRQRVR